MGASESTSDFNQLENPSHRSVTVCIFSVTVTDGPGSRTIREGPARLELVRRRLATRCPKCTRAGRLGVAPDRLLRCCVLKHLEGWSFRDLEAERRSKAIRDCEIISFRQRFADESCCFEPSRGATL